MKYRIVKVYTGYNENSINGPITEFKSNKDVATTTLECMKNLQRALLAQGYSLEHINEFFNYHNVAGGVGSYAHGEEDVMLVIPETSVWYDRVCNEDELYAQHSQAWESLLAGEAVCK